MSTSTREQARRATRSPRRGPSLRRTRFRQAVPLVAPGVIVMAALLVFPFAFGAHLSVRDWQPSGVLGGFVGAEHYVEMLQDPVFWSSLRITFQIFVFGLVAQAILGLGLGYILSLDLRGSRILNAAILTPAMIAPVAVGLVWLLIYDPTLGIANQLLGFVGLGDVNWLGDPDLVVWSVLLVDTWQWTPLVAAIIAANIRSLPQDQFEAAAIDGASAWRMVWHIALPLLRPAIAVALLIRSIDLIRYFDLVFVMTQGGPINSSTTLNVFAYEKGFVDFDLSYSSAIQMAIVVFVAVVAAGMTALRKRWTNDV